MRKLQRGFAFAEVLFFVGITSGGGLVGATYDKQVDACHSKPNITVKSPNGNYSYTMTACEAERKGR